MANRLVGLGGLTGYDMETKKTAPNAEFAPPAGALSDGREVTCIFYDRDRAGALDCDWGGAG